MKWDPYSGDYGVGFFGHAYAAATYLVKDPTFGWLGYGGNITTAGGTVCIEPKDGARTRLFIAPAGAWIMLQAGKIKSATYTPKSREITVTLDAAIPATPNARLFVEATTEGSSRYMPSIGRFERGGYTIALGPGPTPVKLEVQ
jgi:hypothetical protein